MPLLIISGEHIDGQPFSCLGEQLAMLIGAIASLTADCLWFAGDVNTTAGYPFFAPQGGTVCVEVGQTQAVIAAVRMYVQFTDGVFLAVPRERRSLIENVIVRTEAPTYMQLAGALVEIRTFDTSYFEVYSASTEIIGSLQRRFGGELRTAE